MEEKEYKIFYLRLNDWEFSITSKHPPGVFFLGLLGVVAIFTLICRGC